jgi:hypothetical protein
MRWGMNSWKIFPRSCKWACTLKNPCCGGWKISVGRLLLINLLVCDRLNVESLAGGEGEGGDDEPLSMISKNLTFLFYSFPPLCTRRKVKLERRDNNETHSTKNWKCSESTHRKMNTKEETHWLFAVVLLGSLLSPLSRKLEQASLICDAEGRLR